MTTPGVRIMQDRVPDLLGAINELRTIRVMVGVPDDKAGRREGEINNAALAYIHENGAPEAHVPARPFLKPGIATVQKEIEAGLEVAAQLALDGWRNAVVRQFNRVGLRAVSAIRAYMTRGIPPPLAESTLRERARRGRKGAAKELARRAKGLPAGVSLAKPLIDTDQLRQAITYVLRRVGAGH